MCYLAVINQGNNKVKMYPFNNVGAIFDEPFLIQFSVGIYRRRSIFTVPGRVYYFPFNIRMESSLTPRQIKLEFSAG